MNLFRWIEKDFVAADFRLIPVICPLINESPEGFQPFFAPLIQCQKCSFSFHSFSVLRMSKSVRWSHHRLFSGWTIPQKKNSSLSFRLECGMSASANTQHNLLRWMTWWDTSLWRRPIDKSKWQWLCFTFANRNHSTKLLTMRHTKNQTENGKKRNSN